MAQTIALYRGELTLTNQSVSTIFTNTSSGTATRLRVGYLSWQSDFATVSGYLTLSIVRNGGTAYNPVGGTYPGGSPTTARLVGFTSSDSVNVQNIGSIYGTGFSNTVAVTPYRTFAYGTIAYYNSTIMIGPSDSVSLSWQDNGGGAQSCLATYCIVGITES